LNKVNSSKQELLNKLENQIKRQIQLGWKSRLVKIGLEDTLSQIKKGKKGIVILAKDFSERSKRKLFNIFDGKYFYFLTKENLGKMLGKQQVGIIFIPYNKFSLKLENLLNQYLTLQGGNSSCQR
jgi:ribosomal protein L7Ae-like RNA K-turn-binding protein